MHSWLDSTGIRQDKRLESCLILTELLTISLEKKLLAPEDADTVAWNNSNMYSGCSGVHCQISLLNWLRSRGQKKFIPYTHHASGSSGPEIIYFWISKAIKHFAQ